MATPSFRGHCFYIEGGVGIGLVDRFTSACPSSVCGRLRRRYARAAAASSFPRLRRCTAVQLYSCIARARSRWRAVVAGVEEERKRLIYRDCDARWATSSCRCWAVQRGVPRQWHPQSLRGVGDCEHCRCTLPRHGGLLCQLVVVRECGGASAPGHPASLGQGGQCSHLLQRVVVLRPRAQHLSPMGRCASCRLA